MDYLTCPQHVPCAVVAQWCVHQPRTSRLGRARLRASSTLLSGSTRTSQRTMHTAWLLFVVVRTCIHMVPTCRSLQRVPWAHSATPRSCYFVGDDEVAISLLYADPHPMPQLQVVQKTNQGDMSGPDTPTPLHSCTSSTFSGMVVLVAALGQTHPIHRRLVRWHPTAACQTRQARHGCSHAAADHAPRPFAARRMPPHTHRAAPPWEPPCFNL